MADAEFYLLGPYRLDARARILLHSGDPVPLGERAVSVLLLLVEQAGRLVRKDHLVNVAWNGMAVEESNLSVQIAALRRVLDVVPGGWNWIESWSGLGWSGPGRSGPRRSGPRRSGLRRAGRVARGNSRGFQ